MNIAIYTQYPFPRGLAQTNRLTALARGLVYAKCNVEIVCLKPTELSRNIRNDQAKGNHEGIKFRYSSGTTVRNGNFFMRLFFYYYGIWQALLSILFIKKEKKPQAAIIGVVSNVRYFLLILACRVRKIKVVHERSEYPFLSYSDSFIQQRSLAAYKNIICRKFDGLITITHALAAYYKPLLKANALEYLLPILVEPERFDRQEKVIEEKYLAYCGSMEGNKDGVNILIEAFSEIAAEFPDIKLYLIGSTNFKGFDKLTKQINTLHLDNKIVFTGRVERNAMPDYLLSAEAVCLARPTSKQAEGGFPTKLGEYLCSGKPVVVTKVGEIPDYLSDGENAYLAEPDNPAAFAEKLRKVLSNQEEASQIGKNGRKLALEVFNYQTQGSKLAAWLKELI